LKIIYNTILLPPHIKLNYFLWKLLFSYIYYYIFLQKQERIKIIIFKLYIQIVILTFTHIEWYVF
jgi:hypothetical protein